MGIGEFMLRLLGFVSLTGFLLAVIVNISTFQAHNPFIDFPSFALHPLALVIFAVMILTMYKEGELKNGKTTEDFKTLMNSLPAWARILGVIVFAYAIINFALFMANQPKLVNKYQENGRLEYRFKGGEPATEADYEEASNHLLRGFSGHWMVFLLMPSLYFLLRRPRPVAEKDR